MSLDLRPGSVFASDYRIVRPLSEGGMGAVYVVEQLSTGAQRALKLMHREIVQDPGLRERFLQEARVGSKIASDHVVQVIAAGIDPAANVPWLVMELLSGEELDKRVKRIGALPRSEVAEIAKQLCHALSAAHAVGVVHRDLKPNNIFLATARTAGTPFMLKVLDYGIAKVIADAQTSGTMGLGTPLWMAPEQSERGGFVGPGTDLWAVGLITFYMLTGKVFWLAASEPSTSMQTLLRELLIEPIVVASHRAAQLGVAQYLPPGFDAWFARCVDRDPRQREGSAARALQGLLTMLEGWGAPVASSAAAVPASGPHAASGGPSQYALGQSAGLAPSPYAATGQAAPSAPAPAATYAASPVPFTGGFSPSTPASGPTAPGGAWPATHVPVVGPVPAPAPPAQRGSRLGIIAAIAGAVLLLGGGGAIWALSGDGKRKNAKRNSDDDDDDDDDDGKSSSKSRRKKDCDKLVAFLEHGKAESDRVDAATYSDDSAKVHVFANLLDSLSLEVGGLDIRDPELSALAGRYKTQLKTCGTHARGAAVALQFNDDAAAQREAALLQAAIVDGGAVENEIRATCGVPLLPPGDDGS